MGHTTLSLRCIWKSVDVDTIPLEANALATDCRIQRNNSANLYAIGKRLLLLCSFVYFAVFATFAHGLEKTPSFAIDDYFKLIRITELALSSDGEVIVYAVESAENGKPFRKVYLIPAKPGSNSILLEEIQDTRKLTWISGHRKLAFMSDRHGPTQVFSFDLQSRSVRQLTDSKYPVAQFRFAPDGCTLAYITHDKSLDLTLHQKMQRGTEGILIDSDVLRAQHFTDPNWQVGENSPKRQLWLISNGKITEQIYLPGDPIDIHWSSDSKKLAVTYASNTLSKSLFAKYHTNLGIYDITNSQLHLLSKGSPVAAGKPIVAYSSDGWLTGTDKLIVRRTEIVDLFVDPRHPQWAVVDTSLVHPLAENKLAWRELSLTSLDRLPLFFALPNSRILVNKSVKGRYRSLYEATEFDKLKRSDITSNIQGNISMVRFSSNGITAAFVNDNLSSPPELFLWRQGEGARRITNLNWELANKRLPVVREVRWESADATIVRGWLLLPDDPANKQGPWPLITFVHGGPSMPMPVDFAGFFRIWPYPFEVYASHGMAVFLVNYRGNTTFGRAFAEPDREDGEPVDDIVAGIDHLIAQGVADPDRLAISGHSHGAWLASMVMTRYKKFQAASIAEGWGNMITLYDILPGRVNRDLHDKVFGVSLYDDPIRYTELSPILQFDGLQTATLFEAGNQSLAITMMSFPNAAKRAGMPTEFYIYPQTGHNIQDTRLQKESAERNLDWFRFWLKGEEDPTPSKVGQYNRWRKLHKKQRGGPGKSDSVISGFRA